MLNRPDIEDLARLLAACLLALAILVLLPAAQARAAIADTWSWPIAQPWHIERAYLAPPTPYGIGHRGIDLTAALGTPVFAPADGTVLFAGTVVDRGVISIDHGPATQTNTNTNTNTNTSVTSSFEPVIATVAAGDRVAAGDVIGHVSEGTHCACLHLGARINGEYVSPLAFLSAIDRAVLLPWRD